MSINHDALRRAADHIREAMGDLGCLNYELANTIANIFYRFYTYCPDDVQDSFVLLIRGPLSEISNNITQDMDLKDKVAVIESLLKQNITHRCPENKISECAFIIASILTLTKINLAKSMQLARSQGAKEKDIEFFSDVMISIFKYRILDALMKPAYKTKLERLFKQHPKEVPSLVQSMNLYKSSR